MKTANSNGKFLSVIFFVVLGQLVYAQTPYTLYKSNELGSDLKISIASLPDSTLVNDSLFIETIIEGEDLEDEIFLKVENVNDGFLKLKLGYHDSYIYGQFQNVVESGNDTLELYIKAFSDNIPWDKIQIRPEAGGNLSLGKYIQQYPSNWTKLIIPLSDFSETIDFTSISYIEIPYSSNAGPFVIGIKNLYFRGGDTPFEWFGQTHYSNVYDGNVTGQLSATLQFPNENPLQTSSVSLFVNGSLYSTSTQRPFRFSYFPKDLGLFGFKVQLTDNKGELAESPVKSVSFFQLNETDFDIIRLQFNSAPQNIQVSNAPLRYNKEFVYSITLDDGKIDLYTHLFPLLNGGYVEETSESFPGLYFSDGCGNPIPFKGSTAWNSVSASYNDIHTETPDYMTWKQLNELKEAGWGILNHSYSHNAYEGTDYNYEITENQDAVYEHIGLRMKHFVIPSGDIDYALPAFENGLKTVYSNKSTFLGFNSGVRLDPPFCLDSNTFYRRILKDDYYNTSNIMEKIDEIAELSSSTNHLWYHDFSHRIVETPFAESIVWGTLKFYMNSIAEKYGINGTDKIWMATTPEVYDYIKTRNTLIYYVTQIDNEVYLYLNKNSYPEEVDEYALSFLIDSEAVLTNVSATFTSNISFNEDGSSQKLINLNWLKDSSGEAAVESVDEKEFSIAPNPLKSNQTLHINLNKTNSKSVQFFLYNLAGQLVFSWDKTSVSANKQIHLQFPKLNNGLYIFSIENDQKIKYSEKIMIH